MREVLKGSRDWFGDDESSKCVDDRVNVRMQLVMIRWLVIDVACELVCKLFAMKLVMIERAIRMITQFQEN